jgi:hypothetical protein
MDPERWNHVDNLLQSALDRPEAERDVFLRSACGGDEQLEREVRSLLAAHDHADGFLVTPAIDLAARQLTGRSGGDASRAGRDPLNGQTLSHYRIAENRSRGCPGASAARKSARALGRDREGEACL